MSDGFAEAFQASLPQWVPQPVKRRGGGQTPSVMGVTLSTYPALGQLTQVRHGAVPFCALLDVPADQAGPWEAALWWTTGAEAAEDETGGAWTETVLARQDVDDQLVALQTTDAATVRYWFRGTVDVGRGPAWFTAKFRRGDGGGNDDGRAWRWVGDEQGMADGTVVVGAADEDTQTDGLADLVDGLGPALTVASRPSQCPGTRLWRVQTTAAPSVDDASTYTTAVVGTPWGRGLLRWCALVRAWSPWLAPRHGRRRLALDRDAVLVGCVSTAGRHMVLLAVSGVHDQTVVLQSDTAGRLVLEVRSDAEAPAPATVLVAVGPSFEVAIAAAVYEARAVVAAGAAVVDGLDEPERPLSGKGPETDPLPVDPSRPSTLFRESYDDLGFCTWNAFGQDLSEAKILGALDTLAAAGIRIGTLLLDDGWQALEPGHADNQFQRGWAAFEADAVRFPHGLAHTVQQVRARYPHVRHVVVWHALLGYWGGIAPDSPLARAYATTVVVRAHPPRRHLPLAGPMTVIAQTDVARFYADFYRFLATAGVDGTKTDAHFLPDTWASSAARRRLAPATEAAWDAAALRHLAGRAAACMAQTPALVFRQQLPSARPPLLTRTSDDFFPNVPASHPWHVWTNAHTALLARHCNVVPDWDMFQTVHPYAGFHAAARCLSGGPVLLTDAPGCHDTALLAQVAAPGLAGHHVTFRPDVPGCVRSPYADYTDPALLQVGAFHGGAAGAGLLGLFNVHDRPLAELVPVARVPGVSDGDSAAAYVARLHSSGRTSGPRPLRRDGLVPITLAERGYDILTVYRLLTFALHHPGAAAAAAAAADGRPNPPAELHLANLGLVRAMAAAASVVRTTACRRPTTRPAIELTATVKALGVLGIYVSALPALDLADHFLVTLRGLPVPAACVVRAADDAHVLEIDLARAWTALAQTPGWNNEVEVTVHIMW